MGLLPSLPFGKRLPIILLVLAVAGLGYGAISGNWQLVGLAAVAVVAVVFAFPVAGWLLGEPDEDEAGSRRER
jgi:hypothetical protein